MASLRAKLWPAPAPVGQPYRCKVNDLEIEVRDTMGQDVLISLTKGWQFKSYQLSRTQAAALLFGLAQTLGVSHDHTKSQNDR